MIVDNLKKSGMYPDRYHYLGNQQWDYFRYLAHQVGILDNKEENYIRMNQEIYDDSKKYHPKFPGGPDVYRQRNYVVDRSKGEWQSIETEAAEDSAYDTVRILSSGR